MTFFARAAVAVALLLGVYVLAGGVVVLLGWVLHQALVHGLAGYLLGKGLGFLLVLVLVLGRAVHAVRRVRDDPPLGLALLEEDHPALWSEVRRIAATVGTRSPDEIVLQPQVNAMVWEGSRLLGLVPGRRVLVVGSPLLQGLTRQQVRSVLAHELGHFSHGDTALAPVVYRGHLTLAHLVDSLGGWLRRLFAAYLRLYLRVSSAVTRRQEEQADAWSHRVAGRAAAAQAMREVVALDGLWQHFLDDHALSVPGVRPDALHAGFAQLVQSPVRQAEMDEVRADLPAQPATPFDTHPATRGRVAHFDSLPDDGVVDDGVPALSLLDDADGTLLRLEAELFAGSPREPLPWDLLAHRARTDRARRHAAWVMRAAGEPGSGATTLEQALQALARGRARDLVRPFTTIETDPADADVAARAMVRDLVASALVERGGARFPCDWDGADTLVDDSGRTIDVAGLVSDVVQQGAATWLVDALADEGVPPSYAIDVAALDAEDLRDREPAVQSVASCIHWRRLRFVVVAENGLVVKRLGWGEALRAAGRHGHWDAYRNGAAYVAGLTVPQLLADERATLYDWDQVGPARLTRGRLVLALDGRTHRLRVKRAAVLGDLAGSLQQHLGDRLVCA